MHDNAAATSGKAPDTPVTNTTYSVLSERLPGLDADIIAPLPWQIRPHV